MTSPATRKSKNGLVRFSVRRITSIRPSPENEELYRPVDPNDPEIIALAASIKEHGVQEHLVITADGYILSGHRRYVAAQLAGLQTVPVKIHRIRRDKDHDRFLVLLREHNRQRVKTFAEKVREEIVSADPEEAHRSLVEHRNKTSAVDVDTITLRGEKRRATITEAKMPLLESGIAIIDTLRKYWPLSVRQIHYELLNDPPLRHARKPESTYVNNRKSYRDIVDLIVRARLTGAVPWEAIGDDTRPVVVWDVHQDVQGHIRREFASFLKNYWRDLMQGQPNHVEIVGEKLTIQSYVRPVADKFCIPYTLGRGFANLDVRAQIVRRWQASGKDKLVLLFLTDLDPDGEEIAHSFARSLRDDFGVDEELIVPIKAGLTPGQVEQFSLPTRMTAKGGSRRNRFVQEHGESVWEMEALTADQMQGVLTTAIDSVIDADAFNYEIELEKADAAHLDVTRRRILAALRELDIEGAE